jgi:hypothetical protein
MIPFDEVLINPIQSLMLICVFFLIKADVDMFAVCTTFDPKNARQMRHFSNLKVQKA